jgi:hypothetical protein
MTTTTSVPFINSKYSIPISVTDFSVQLASFTELTLVMTNLTVDATSYTFTLTGGGLVVSSGTLTLELDDDSVTVAGVYALKLSGTLSGENVNITLTSGRILQFYEHE